MSAPRYAKRRDLNESPLIALARQLGAWLIKTDWPTDWLMWFRDRWDLVEVKRPDKEGWKDEYTRAQKEFRAEATRRGARLITWRVEGDVLATLGAARAA